MKGFLRFLLSWRFVMNFGLIVVAVFLLIWLTQFWLKAYTEHGESVDVPDLSGLTLDKIDITLKNTDLNYEITDSIYSNEFPRGSVVLQNPASGSAVKRGRTVFLTVNSILPEMVLMPGLTGKSRRIAIPVLEISGLELASLEYKPDESCTDCVIDQLYEGKSIEAGALIRKGEKITLVLGQQSRDKTMVPKLYGYTYEEASEMLNAQSLNMGVVLACEGCSGSADTARAFVVNQAPSSGGEVNLGAFIDVFLSTDSSAVMRQQAATDTLSYEIL